MGEQGQNMLVELQGQIERITFINAENGFTIARVKVYGQRDLVTVVGNLMAPYIFLQRNLNTAVTRGRKLVVMVGTKKALAIRISNDKTEAIYLFKT